MPVHDENNRDYSSLKPSAGKKRPLGENGRDDASVSAFKSGENDPTAVSPRRVSQPESQIKDDRETRRKPVVTVPAEKQDQLGLNETVQERLKPLANLIESESSEEEDQAAIHKREKARKAKQRDENLLSADSWLLRNGHSLSYAGLFLFTVFLYFRPYELIPGLGFLSSAAFFISLATLIIFVPSQLAAEGNLTARPPEMNYLLLLALVGLVTIPIARDSSMAAWETFNDVFIKVVLMFIVMVNVLRTEFRLKALMWLSLGVGLMLSISALRMYMAGEFTVEEYRVGVDVGGMFGNPNELALHFVMFIPIAVVLGLSTRNFLFKGLYFGVALLMTAATVVTFSRGGFLGLIAAVLVMAWKLGREQRLNVMLIVGIIGILFILLAPGNYGLRIMSIFIPGLDPVGSSNQRSELLKQSFWVSLRNPWGIGMGNFQIGSSRNLVTHNAYTQVSAELGIVGLALYMMFIISPFRRLGAIERELFDSKEYNWMYYLAVGIQASIVAYMVGSFFGSFAYNWFVYYPVAYAIAVRRIYLTGKELGEKREEAAASSAPVLQTA